MTIAHKQARQSASEYAAAADYQHPHNSNRFLSASSGAAHISARPKTRIRLRAIRL
jgi:hypothetical protein